MSITPEKTAELRVKHLEMVQSIITRMAGQGATLKNYCITLVTAVCGFAVSLQKPGVALLALLPITIFWLLDAQYLRVERRFRGLFDKVRTEDWQMEPSFKIALADAPACGFWSASVSWSIASFYMPLALGVGAVVTVLKVTYGKW